VHDVCVVGEPDDEWGERVVAYVVATEGRRAPTLEELRAFAREQLSAPKLPRAIRVVDAIPRTASGKALRRELRDAP
jgi:acyl-CoA synthetase (AMP-forming)/AMP-acid ligase II